jgi:type II secretory pathway component GspD/PulD (secretin)
MPRPHATNRRWSGRVLAGLLIALTAWTSAWPQASMRHAGRAPLRPLGAGIPVAVHAGQLSVDLWEAPVQEVLAAISQQAGVRVHIDASAHHTVTAQFTDMMLDQGLRRLLRAASLSYTLLYARGPAATVILQEVRVFGEARGAVPASHDWAGTARAQRVAALRPPLSQEEHTEPELTELEHEAELEHETEFEPAEPEQDVDTAQD